MSFVYPDFSCAAVGIGFPLRFQPGAGGGEEDCAAASASALQGGLVQNLATWPSCLHLRHLPFKGQPATL